MKFCLWCGEDLVRKDGEQASKFAERATCNRSCASSLTEWRKREERIRNPRAFKECVTCLSTFAQGPDEGRREFDRRRACCGECRGALRTYSYTGAWPEWVLEERRRLADYRLTLEQYLERRRERLAKKYDEKDWGLVA